MYWRAKSSEFCIIWCISVAGVNTERAHLLQDVIDNIELASDYYKNKTLTCVLKSGDGLLKEYKDADRIWDLVSCSIVCNVHAFEFLSMQHRQCLIPFITSSSTLLWIKL